MTTHSLNTFEVEQKFRVEDAVGLAARLHALPTAAWSTIEQVDTYFAHPARDFTVTDEAFRLRRVGDANFVTYKGPKLDAATKTRRELELPLPEGGNYAGDFQSLMEALGFRVVADVHKFRRRTSLTWEGVEIEVSLDDVIKVGHYVELELVVDESLVASAKAHIASLARELMLTQNERRSYLELLLEPRLE